MKWLLGNWCGRLYLVVQIVCLAITTYLCVQYMKEEGERETRDTYEIWRFYGIPKRDGGYPPPEEADRIKRDISKMKQRLNEERRQFILRCALPNLGVPALWAIGLFVARGFPAKKTSV